MAARLEPAVVPPKPRRSPVAATLAACAALGVLLPGFEGCHGGTADSEAIRALVAKEVAAINARDLPALSEIWSKDQEILLFDVPPPGRFQGWDQIGALWKGFFDKVSDVHLVATALQATSDGTLGYATYDWAMTGRLGSYALDDRGQATEIYRKVGGRWRLVHSHFSPAPPAPAGEPARAAASPGAAGVSAGSSGPAPARGTGPADKPAAPGAGKPEAAGAGKPAPAGQEKPGASPPPATPAPGATPGRAGQRP